MNSKLNKFQLIFYSDENDKIWYWDYNEHRLYYDIGEEVKLKIFDVKYKTANDINKNLGFNSGNNYLNSEYANTIEKFSFENFMEVLGSFNQEGLGPNKWWQ